MIISNIMGKIYYITKKVNNDILNLYNYFQFTYSSGSGTCYIGRNYKVDSDETTYAYINVEII